MTIRDKINGFIDKPFDEYTLCDVIELSKLKLKVGQLAMTARAKANEEDGKYRLERSKQYIENKLLKCSDKLAHEKAFIETDTIRIKADLAKADSEILSSYHRDLNDIVIAVRMCSRVFDEVLQSKID